MQDVDPEASFSSIRPDPRLQFGWESVPGKFVILQNIHLVLQTTAQWRISRLKGPKRAAGVVIPSYIERR